MPELLLELFSEEIPARMQARAAEDLKKLVTEKLTAAGLAFTKAEAFVTPRRLALVVDGLPEKQPDVSEEKKGPRVGAPEQAIQGFLKAAGLTSLEQCERRTVGKAEFWFAIVGKKGRATADVLSNIAIEILVQMPWPKSMRWADNSFRWIRPLTGAVGIFDSRPLPGFFGLGRFGNTEASLDELRQLVTAQGSTQLDSLKGKVIVWSDTTRGHRFLAPEPFKVASFEDYKTKLRSAYVVLDAAERRAMILRDAEKIASLDKLKVKPDQGLLEEVAGLVEWPVVLMGSIDPAFMDLPPEVLTTSMRAHQKYFSVLTEAGELAPRFVVVANMLTDDGGSAIVAGNERVLRARLSDAKFFWDLDRKTKLSERLSALRERVFHARLGSMHHRAQRISSLSENICSYFARALTELAREAGQLCKADLSTGMVGEFPELQGTMGGYYAMHEGLDPSIARAISEHYSPKGAADAVPTLPVSVSVALADKLDTLVGFFGIDEKPTGSKDPYALRRAALGAIRIVLENKLRLNLSKQFEDAFLNYDWGLNPDTDQGINIEGGPTALRQSKHMAEKRAKEVAADLLDFFADRLKVALREKGVRHDLIDAVFSLGGEDDLVRLLARVEALGAFLKTDDGANLLVAYRRASNIVAIEEKKDKKTHDGAVNQEELTQPEEVTLAKALGETHEGVQMLLKREEFAGAMKAMALLRKPVDAFFDKVTVNAPEANLRANRLRLLSRIRATLGEVADFSKIEG